MAISKASCVICRLGVGERRKPSAQNGSHKFFAPTESPHGVGVLPDVTKAEVVAAMKAAHGAGKVVDPVLRFAIEQ